MNKLDKYIIDNTNFLYNPCLEFACAFNTIGNLKYLKKLSEDLNYNIPEEDMIMFDKMYNSMTKHMKNEMEYFNGIYMMGVVLVAYISDYEPFNDVKALLDFIEKSDETIFFNYLGGGYISEYESSLHEKWDEVNKDINKMLEYIKNIEIDNKEIKERIVDCFVNHDETKQRLCFLFRNFYEKVYKQFEEQVKDKCQRGIGLYREILLKNPKEFMDKYLLEFFKVEGDNWDYKINIHVSLFKEVYFWVINMHDYKEKRGWVILGLNTKDIVYKKQLNEHIENFLKALSDPRRIKIIKLLSKRPHYGYEIASILELTPATVNHHMNFLFDADIISINKFDNKVYFELKHEKVRELFRETEKMLLNND